MKRIAIGLPVLLSVLVVLSARVGSTGIAPPKRPPRLPDQQAVGQLYEAANAVLDAPSDKSPGVDSDKAIDIAWALDATGPGSTATSEQAILGDLTPTPTGLSAVAEPTTVWAIVYQDACVPNYGPANQPAESGTTDGHCLSQRDWVVFVDAETGEVSGEATI